MGHLNFNYANRDPSIFRNPDAFDAKRNNDDMISWNGKLKDVNNFTGFYLLCELETQNSFEKLVLGLHNIGIFK